MNLKKLLIINGCEKPCAYLVCRVMPNGKIQYVNKKLRKKYGNLKEGRESATLDEFGFVQTSTNKFKLFFREADSIAKYLDGKPRFWQGKSEFTYNEIMNMQNIDYAGDN